MQNATLFYQNLRLHELLAVVIARNHSSAAFLSESTFKELEAISERRATFQLSLSELAARYRADEKLGSTPSTCLALFFKAGKEVNRLYEIPHIHDLALLVEQLYQD